MPDISIKKLFGSLRSHTPLLGGTVVLGLDIGTENVKAIIAKVQGDKIDIVGIGRAHQSQSDMVAGAIADIAGVTANCADAIDAAVEQAGVAPSTCVIGIAGELVKGTTITMKFTRADSKKPIDVNEVDKIIVHAQKTAEEEAIEQITLEMGVKDIDVKLVNSALVQMTIDGYSISNPIGFQGKEVVVQLYTAYAPLIHIGALERVATELGLELLAVAAEPFAVSRAVIGNDPNASLSAVLMDIGGGTTDIAVVSEGGVQGTRMFGIGGRAFTKAIERELDTDYLQAETLKIAHSNGSNTPEKIVPKIDKAIHSTIDVWIEGVKLALEDFELDSIPHRFVLCGGGSSLVNIVETLETTEWYIGLPFTRKPTVHLLNSDMIISIDNSTDVLLDHTFATAQGLLRVASDTYGSDSGRSTVNSSNNPYNIRKKLMKVLKI
jgi:cell division protein FtsA